MSLEKREIRYGGAMFDDAERDAVMAVMSDPLGPIPGAKVCEFEQRVAEFMGKQHGVMVNSGSSALMIAMRLLNLPAGSEVITPATKAMLISDLIGGICDWDRVREIADKHDLKLVHDSADTLGGSLRGKKTATRADISITSFSIYHIITALGNGGMVFFDDEKYLDRALSLRAWGRSSEKFMFGTQVTHSDGRFLEPLDGVDYDSVFIFEDQACGFIPNEAGAAFGIEQMNKIDRMWELRERYFNRHYQFFEAHHDKFIVPRIIPDTETTWICYPIQIRPETGWSRRKLQIHLEDSGIFSRVIFSGNITRHPMMKGYDYRVHPAGLANCDQIMENGVMLPCHPTMTEDDCDYLYQVLQAFIDADGQL